MSGLVNGRTVSKGGTQGDWALGAARHLRRTRGRTDSMVHFTIPLGDECYASLTHRHNSGDTSDLVAVERNFRNNRQRFQLI